MIGHPEQVEPEIERDRVGLHAPESAPHRVPDVRGRGALADPEEAAGQGDDHVKGKHASVRERAGVVKRQAACALDQLEAEAALSRAWLPGHQDDGRPT